MKFAVLLLVTSGLSAVGVGLVRRYALSRSLLDRPNARSSHTTPTPRGGGLAIAAVTLLATALTGWAGWIGRPLALSVVVGGGLVAFVGWLDDNDFVGTRTRLAAHFAAAAWALFWLGGVKIVDLGVTIIPLGLIGWVLGILGIVWATNLYNFMDGIDGLAAGQATLGGAAAALLLVLSGDGGHALAAGIVAAACAGFLPWNRPPARIFMGDVGSGTLGYALAAIALSSANAASLSLLAWSLLFGVFIFDASVTLFRRLRAGSRGAEAHREHAYQRAVRLGYSHAAVTTACLALACGMALLAWAGSAAPPLLLVAWVAGYGLLAAAYLWVERRFPLAAYASPATANGRHGRWGVFRRRRTTARPL